MSGSTEVSLHNSLTVRSALGLDNLYLEFQQVPNPLYNLTQCKLCEEHKTKRGFSLHSVTGWFLMWKKRHFLMSSYGLQKNGQAFLTIQIEGGSAGERQCKKQNKTWSSKLFIRAGNFIETTVKHNR